MEKKEAMLNFLVICIIGICWQLWSNKLTAKNDNDASESWTYLSQWKHLILWGNLFLFIVLSLGIIVYFLTRRQKETVQHEKKKEDDEIKEEEEDEDLLPKIKIAAESSDQEVIPNILTLEQIQTISKLAFPPTISSSSYYTKWTRLYCLARDGDAFLTFLNKVEKNQRTLLVVKTTNGSVFGGYADSAWEISHTNGQWGGGYYGSAQACLFRVVKEANGADSASEHNDKSATTEETTALKSKEKSSTGTHGIKVYKWAGINRYIQLCNAQRKIIAFGGGNNASAAASPSFGLILENDFQRGSTSKCDTFDNEPLCNDDDEGGFSILDMECWGFSTCLDFS